MMGVIGGMFPGGIPEASMKALAKYLPGYGKFQPVKRYTHGGVIPEPTLLTSLRTMRPYAIAGDKGAEIVSPMARGYRTANIYFQVDGRELVKIIGQPLVDEIRLKTGAHI